MSETKARILIIEDEEVIRQAVERLLTRHGYEATTADSLEAATEGHDLSDFDLILSDLRLPGEEGTAAMKLVQDVPVIIMTSYASVRSAVDAMRKGAVDYIAKPFDNDELLLTIERILKAHMISRQNRALKADLGRDYPVQGMIGGCQPMQAVFSRVGKVAPTDVAVLVLGESGTGKELVARALHEQSPRKDAPLIAVNCAAIPENLIEAELFGHEKGAFTGAVGSRTGLVEAADGGSLFLDEIGELTLSAQARLLRVLQEGEIRKVGTTHARRVNVRLIAATNRDLGKMIDDGDFREDLYFRINAFELKLPPLRERGEDIVALAYFFLKKASARLHKPDMELAEDAKEAMLHYHWPGNVRELENSIERAVILADNNMIHASVLGLQANRGKPDSQAPDLSLEAYFRQFVLEHQDHMTETELARKLGISRKALWERRQRFNLPRSKNGH